MSKTLIPLLVGLCMITVHAQDNTVKARENIPEEQKVEGITAQQKLENDVTQQIPEEGTTQQIPLEEITPDTFDPTEELVEDTQYNFPIDI